MTSGGIIQGDIIATILQTMMMIGGEKKTGHEETRVLPNAKSFPSGHGAPMSVHGDIARDQIHGITEDVGLSAHLTLIEIDAGVSIAASLLTPGIVGGTGHGAAKETVGGDLV